jgi:hypothetical protein
MYLSKSPEKNPPKFPLQSPYIEKADPLPEPSLRIFQSPHPSSPYGAPT